MMVPDPNGVPRPVVEAGNHGSLINEINLKLDPRTGEVIRELTRSTNHANTRDVPLDEELQYIADYWTAQGKKRYATPLARVTADFTRTPNASGTAGTGRATSATSTATGSCTSAGGPGTGSGSTRRTSPRCSPRTSSAGTRCSWTRSRSASPTRAPATR